MKPADILCLGLSILMYDPRDLLPNPILLANFARSSGILRLKDVRGGVGAVGGGGHLGAPQP